MIAAFVFSSPAHAFDGHNGIRFDMSQKDVEKLGFVCNPEKEQDSYYKADCEHMDMTGVVFGHPTKDYVVNIGPSNKVDMIQATFSELKTIYDPPYYKLRSKIEHFFPTKDESVSFNSPGNLVRDGWRSNNTALAVLVYVKGSPPIIETSLNISFFSPRYVSAQGM